MANTLNSDDNSKDSDKDAIDTENDPNPDEASSAETAEADDSTEADAPDESDDPTAEDSAENSNQDEDTADDTKEVDLPAVLAASPLISDGSAPEVEEPVQDAADTHDHHDHDVDHAEEHHDEDHHEEEHGRSLAARVLTWLVLLLAGGGLALWGAPRIAPGLPDGLGPVKAWLMPGELQSQARIAELEAELNARLEALSQGADTDDVQAAISAAVADAEARFSDTIQALSDQVGAVDGGEVEARLAQLQTRVEGLAAEVDVFSGMATSNEALTEAERAEMGAFSAAVEGLRAELAALAEQQGSLSQRIDDVEVTASRRIAEARQEVETIAEEASATKSTALAQAAASTIAAAISAGDPFEPALEQLAANTDLDIPAGLSASAPTGVAPLGMLREGFGDAAHAAIRAAIKAKDDSGVGGRLASFIEAQVATRSLTPQEGDSTDAILSRAEDALRRDNLAASVTELEALPEPAREAMRAWLDRAEARVAAVSGLAQIDAALGAGN